MKKLGSVLASVLIAALVLALPAPALAGGKTHEMKGTVVSVDTKANTLTFTDDQGASHTAPLLDKAVKEAASLKAGEKIMVTCQDTDKGEHQGITKVKKEA
jgi:hypothetical protein